MAFGDYQNEIYFQGLSGVVPRLPMVFAELEAKAEKALPPSIWSYVAGGAGDERTQRANVTAFERLFETFGALALRLQVLHAACRQLPVRRRNSRT